MPKNRRQYTLAQAADALGVPVEEVEAWMNDAGITAFIERNPDDSQTECYTITGADLERLALAHGIKLREENVEQREEPIRPRRYGGILLIIVEAGLAGDAGKVRAYTELLAQNVRDAGDAAFADRLQRVLEGKGGESRFYLTAPTDAGMPGQAPPKKNC